VEERKAYNTLKERTELLEECHSYTKGNTTERPLQLVYPLEVRSSESKRTQPVREENVVADEKDSNMVQYHDTIRMVNFINPTSTIGIVVDLYPLYSASLPVVPLVRYGYGS
jgi:hypothetical protein